MAKIVKMILKGAVATILGTASIFLGKQIFQ